MKYTARFFLFILLALSLQLQAKTYKLVPISSEDIYNKTVLIDTDIEVIKDYFQIAVIDAEVSWLVSHVNGDFKAKHIWQLVYLIDVKINRFRIKHGLPRIEKVGIAPKVIIDNNILYEMLERLHTELAIIQKQFGIKTKNTKRDTNYNGDLPLSETFNQLIHISKELDVLNDETIKPSNVFAQVMRIHHDITLILNKLEIKDNSSVPAKNKDSKPVDAFNKAMILMNTVQKIKLQYNQEIIDFSGLRHKIISPEEVFILISMINAELQTIKLNVNIRDTITIPAKFYENKIPGDVEQLLAWNMKRMNLIFKKGKR